MKRLLFLITLFSFYQAIAQETVPTFKKRIYKARIFTGDSIILKGYLTNISDSALLISTRKQRFGSPNATGKPLKKVPYSAIPELVIKRKGSVSKGFWIGALSGMTIGIIVGAIEDRRSVETDALHVGFSMGGAYGFLGFAGGGLLGLLISSSFKKTFIIGGKKQEFDSMKATVLEMTYRKSK